jgi:hypothetical protein
MLSYLSCNYRFIIVFIGIIKSSNEVRFSDTSGNL